jgi:hypothetical protein
MAFNLFDGATSIVSLWSESHLVTVNNGIYSLSLGGDTVIPPSVLSIPDLYLEIDVEGQTLSPRQKITAVVFAMNADRIDGKRLEAGTRTLSLPMPANQATVHVAFDRPFTTPPRVVVSFPDNSIGGQAFVGTRIYNVTADGFDVDYVSLSGTPVSGSATFGYEAFGE